MLTVGDDRHCPLALGSCRVQFHIIRVVADLIKTHIHRSLGAEGGASGVGGKPSNQLVCVVTNLHVRGNAARLATNVDLPTNCSAA